MKSFLTFAWLLCLPLANLTLALPSPQIHIDMAQEEINRFSKGLSYSGILKDKNNGKEIQRDILAIHCLAIEKDGLAMDPYAYLHEGIPFFLSYLKPRNCESLQGVDAILKNGQLSAGIHIPTTHFLNPRNCEPYLPLRDSIVPQMLTAAQAMHPAHPGKKLFPNGILIFVHGGNNELAGAIERAERLIDPIEEAGYYPVFVCWNSDLVSTWWEQMRFIRNGVDMSKPGLSRAYAELTTPIYVASDLATAIARAPRTFVDTLYGSGKGSVFHHSYFTMQAADQRYDVLRKRLESAGVDYQPTKDQVDIRAHCWLENSSKPIPGPLAALWNRDPYSNDSRVQAMAANKAWFCWHKAHPHDMPLIVSKGEYATTVPDEFGRFIGYFGLLAPKGVFVGALNGAGESMWKMMTRRVRTMFFNTNSYNPSLSAHYDENDREFWDSSSTGIGGFAVFLRQLENTSIRVTATGHSMGAMVLDEAVRQFPRINYSKFIYMAPACSIRDYNDSVVPYLRRHRNTECFILCLNPFDENRERPLGDSFVQAVGSELLPRGSLLVWIDEFLNHPESFPDRTLGQFENALLASKMFHPFVQSQIHICAFESIAGNNHKGPKHHGAFGNYAFWCEEFYAHPAWGSVGSFEDEDKPATVSSKCHKPKQ